MIPAEVREGVRVFNCTLGKYGVIISSQALADLYGNLSHGYSGSIGKDNTKVVVQTHRDGDIRSTAVRLWWLKNCVVVDDDGDSDAEELE